MSVPGDLLNLGIELRSPAVQAVSLPSEPPGKPKGCRELAIEVVKGCSHFLFSTFYFENLWKIE